MTTRNQLKSVNVASTAEKAQKVVVGITKDFLVPTAITVTTFLVANAGVKKLVSRYGSN